MSFLRFLFATVALAGCNLLIAVDAFAQPPSFEGTYHRIELNVDANEGIVADFNLDGLDDIAVTGDYSGGVDVLIARGDGSFAIGETVPTGGGARGGLAGRFNEDDWIDLAIANRTAGTISILRGQAGGSFVNIGTLTPSPGLNGLAKADFNGDGVLDLAASCGTSSVLSLFFGLGSAAFDSAASVPLPSSPSAVTAGDVDQDSLPDLVVALPAIPGFAFLRGNGDGTFQAPVIVSGGLPPQSLELADLDDNGTLDVVVSECCGVRVWLGAGDGTFPASALYGIPGSGAPPAGVGNLVIEDLDSDGTLDIVTFGRLHGELVWLRGLGDGTFQSSANILVESSIGSIASGDFNGDGHRDLLSVYEDVSVLLGNGDGTFGSGLLMSTAAAPYHLELVDLDADGDSDVVVASSWPTGTVGVFLGDGHGGFGTRADFPAGGSAGYFAAGDLNGDGLVDLVVANTAQDSLSVLLGRGDGSFSPPMEFPTSDAPYTIALADFDMDGHIDVAVGGWDGVAVHLGDGAGGLSPATLYTDGRSPAAVRTADLNQDGFPDVIAPMYGDLVVSVLLGRGDGTFEGFLRTGRSTDPVDFTIGDFDGNGLTDVATIAEASEPIRVSVGAGDGTLVGLEPDWYSIDYGSCIRTLNIDRDGNVDLLAVSGGLRPMLGRGDGTFERTATHYGAPWDFDELATGDVDGDGFDDAVIGAADRPAIMVLRNLAGSEGNTGVVPRQPASAATLRIAPSPVQAATTIYFTLTKAAEVELSVFDVSGRRLKQLIHGFVNAGVHETRWDLVTDSGARIHPGVYFVSLHSGPQHELARLVVIQ